MTPLMNMTVTASVQPQPSPTEAHPPAAQPPAGHPFAELLRRNQAPVTPAEAKPASAQADSADDAAATGDATAAAAGTADDTAATADAGAPPSARRARLHGAATAAMLRPSKGNRADKVERTDGTGPAAAKADTDKHAVVDPAATPNAAIVATGAATDPTLAQWLADLHLPPAPRAESAKAHGDASDAALRFGDGGNEASSGRGKSLLVAAAADAADLADARMFATGPQQSPTTRDAFDAAAGVAQQQLTAAIAQAAAAPRETRLGTAGELGVSRAEPNANANAAAIAIAAFHPAALLATAQAPIDINLATPLSAPDFAQALGVQVSVLAKDGVQRAELHLTPAEMGPVSVQIVIDGTQARVDFGADLAATRHAIEAGLPALASALRDAGLTLSGGGVSQHARGGGSETDGGAPQAGRGGPRAERDGEAEAVRPLRQRLTAAGGVDLYA